MRKCFVAVCSSSGAASLEVLYAMQHCIDIVLCSAICLNVFEPVNCFCAMQATEKRFLKAQPLSDAGKALQTASLQCLPYATLPLLESLLFTNIMYRYIFA